MSGTQVGTLALLGCGYMGGSLALAARQAGLVGAGGVVGFDADPASADKALALGIVDRVAGSAAEAAVGADLIVLAAPVRSLVPLARDIAGRVEREALVLDLGSVKGPVVEGIRSTALRDRFVGCHPLAGTEASGPAAADDRLYAGKPCFVCPVGDTVPTMLERAERFWRGLGATVLRLDPEAHDLFMAAASHLPHVAAFTLAASLADQADMLEVHIPPSYPPTSLRDCTRVAASNPAVWRDILIENRAHLLPLVDRLQERLTLLRRSLADEDGAALQQVLAQGQAVRRRLVR